MGFPWRDDRIVDRSRSRERPAGSRRLASPLLAARTVAHAHRAGGRGVDLRLERRAIYQPAAAHLTSQADAPAKRCSAATRSPTDGCVENRPLTRSATGFWMKNASMR